MEIDTDNLWWRKQTLFPYWVISEGQSEELEYEQKSERSQAVNHVKIFGRISRKDGIANTKDLK